MEDDEDRPVVDVVVEDDEDWPVVDVDREEGEVVSPEVLEVVELVLLEETPELVEGADLVDE